MTLKEIVENNPVLLSLSLLLAGFMSGIAAYDFVLRVAHLDTVPTSEIQAQKKEADQLKRDSIESAQKISVLTIEKNNLSSQLESEKRQLATEILTQLQGEWINQDPKTRGITRFHIERRGGDVFVDAWGSCQSTDCDWGEQRALIDKDSAVLLWDESFVFRKMVIRLNRRTDLRADYLSIFTDQSGRPKYDKVEVFNYQEPANQTETAHPASSLTVEQPNTAAPRH